MKLYWGPHTCAIGIHVLLEEIGARYETEKIDVADGATHAPPFIGVNPKGKVPTLVRDDGTVLTEFSAIATWLARTHPGHGLLPSDPEVEARIIETIAYVEGTIHGQGFARLFKPEIFEPQDIVHQTAGLGRSSVKRCQAAVHSYTLALRDALHGRVEVIELAPPGVQTGLTPGQESRPGYQPLDAFADEVMAQFAQHPTPREILVERVRFLRFAEAENRFDATMSQLNEFAAKAREGST